MIKILFLVCLMLVNAPTFVDKQLPAPGNIKLIRGYKHKTFEATDVMAGEIYKDGGLAIRYAIGAQEGQVVTPDKKSQYTWYKEQVVNDWQFNCALTKEMKLLITVVMDKGNPKTAHAANFYAAIKNSEDIADVLLMVLTFDPSAT